jgi:hypothetical protein
MMKLESPGRLFITEARAPGPDTKSTFDRASLAVADGSITETCSIPSTGCRVWGFMM